jgi:PIN domain nuclease of toxin-antitoxin system
MPDPQLYVTDTHSLLWHLYDLPQLTPAVQAAFAEVENGEAILLIPAIVLAEIIFTVERRRHDINVTEILDRIATADNYQILPFDLNAARCLPNVTAISEMHDRMIVCEAVSHQVPLITRDEEIRRSGIVQTIW